MIFEDTATPEIRNYDGEGYVSDPSSEKDSEEKTKHWGGAEHKKNASKQTKERHDW